MATTRQQKLSESKKQEPKLSPTDEYWGATHPPPQVHVSMDSSLKTEWVASYLKDPHFKNIWKDKESDVDEWKNGYRYFKDKDGLLFFRDEDYQPRLCVPRDYQRDLLIQAHKSAIETAHGG
ncbi:hypothetical protein GALMADRAFT_80140, partial [Galerina marginata CBS 339.88]